MVSEILPRQTVLTPNGAKSGLQSKGLDAFGLTVPNISPVWSSAAPVAYNQAEMTLALSNMRVPFRGIREFVDTPTIWSDVTGLPLVGPAVVFRFHPEATRRLSSLVEARYGSPFIRSVPVAIVVRGITMPSAPIPAKLVLPWRYPRCQRLACNNFFS